jgi:heme-degrading monooxygenase HmoA
MSVVLINPFEVPEGREEETLAQWDRVAAYMRRQPGFIATRLHRAVSPGARFHFVNVAEWTSADAFQAVIASEEFRRLTAGTVPHFPALYEVVRDLPPAGEDADTGA